MDNEKKTKKQDFFAKVAMEHGPSRKEELAESLPLEFKVDKFDFSGRVCEKVIKKSYEEQLEDFQSSLASLREKFEPFMADYVPGKHTARNTVKLSQFDFRYEWEEDKRDVGFVLDGRGEWEKIRIPDYRGPIGKWTGYYRTTFTYGPVPGGNRAYLCFRGVDYIANVYLNNRYIGSHEGFFAAFEFDVTNVLLSDRENVLLVEVKNDIPTVGLDADARINGDKIYACTGLGWDDPREGWHHCPPGAGIYDTVLLEQRPEIFIDSVFVRPDIDSSSVEVRVQVYNTENRNRKIRLSATVFPRNFEGGSSGSFNCEELEPAGAGMNYYSFEMGMPGCRLWDCEEPWLYTARAAVAVEDGFVVDEADSVFGMRKFHMDEAASEKGTLYLNNKPVILRGANDMGHMQQCVARCDFGQLADDILIAKLCNMNYYRFTQRPVQQEIYYYCDMLGMMNQTDLPLFGYLRRNQLCEAVRQSGEMERHIRNHPSAIMISYINEPFPVKEHKLEHRHLTRNELEAFFEAADRLVHVENPDRVIKHAEGDYDPPTGTGLSDFHCYNMWYTNHALPIGKLYKGYLPALKKGWKTGCGEYGTEGLDNHEVMRKFYPREWLPSDDADTWTPEGIIGSQSYSMHGDWYEEQRDIDGWIMESQRHQALATSIMTDALRRRSDRVVSTAIHLLIDAWPSGWMKTLVGVDRIPKPAYFAFRDSLEPVRVNLRCDRWKAYAGEIINVEAWYMNDTPECLKGCRVVATLRDGDRDCSSFETKFVIQPVSAAHIGIISIELPQVKGRKKAYLDAMLEDGNGQCLNYERFELEVFERPDKEADKSASFIGDCARRLLEAEGITAVGFEAVKTGSSIFISDPAGYEKHRKSIEMLVELGSTVVFLEPEAEDVNAAMDTGLNICPEAGQNTAGWEFGGYNAEYKYIFGAGYVDGVDSKGAMGVYFVARNQEESLTGEYLPDDFSFMYNKDSDMLDFIALKYIKVDGLTPMLFTFKKPGFQEQQKGCKEKLVIAGELKHGQGKAYFISLCLGGLAGVNPTLDSFIRKLVLPR